MPCFLPSEAWEVEAALADGGGDIELFRAVVEAGDISAGALARSFSPPAVAAGFRRWKRVLVRKLG